MAEKYRAELAETARKICTPGKGILAADESEGTIGKKFASLQGVENNAENRRRYRECLLTTPDFEKYISGVIFFQE
jgi:fructose-bisphosphate aldolase class I